MLSTDSLMLWTMKDTEHLDRPTAVALMLLRASMHVSHVVSVKTSSRRGMKEARERNLG